jgi:hypothetical protein
VDRLPVGYRVTESLHFFERCIRASTPIDSHAESFENELELRFPLLKFIPRFNVFCTHEIDFCLKVEGKYDAQRHVVEAYPLALVVFDLVLDDSLVKAARFSSVLWM